MSLLSKLFPSFFPAPGTPAHDAAQIRIFFSQKYCSLVHLDFNRLIQRYGTPEQHNQLMRLQFPNAFVKRFSPVIPLAFAFPLADFAGRWGFENPLFPRLYQAALRATNFDPVENRNDTAVMIKTAKAIMEGRKQYSREDLLTLVMADNSETGLAILQPFVDAVVHETAVWFKKALNLPPEENSSKIIQIAKDLCHGCFHTFDRERFMSQLTASPVHSRILMPPVG
jgi:hypothetical protein